MRGLRIAAGAQLRLRMDDPDEAGLWEELPEPTRALVLALLARMIAKGVLSEGEVGTDD